MGVDSGKRRHRFDPRGIIISGLPGTLVWALGLLVGIGGASLIAIALEARKEAAFTWQGPLRVGSGHSLKLPEIRQCATYPRRLAPWAHKTAIRGVWRWVVVVTVEAPKDVLVLGFAIDQSRFAENDLFKNFSKPSATRMTTWDADLPVQKYYNLSCHIEVSFPSVGTDPE
jgi:hypothetical protein